MIKIVAWSTDPIFKEFFRIIEGDLEEPRKLALNNDRSMVVGWCHISYHSLRLRIRNRLGSFLFPFTPLTIF